MQLTVKGATFKIKGGKKKSISLSSENTASLPAMAQNFGDAVVSFDRYGDIYLRRIRFLPVTNQQKISFFPLTSHKGLSN